MADKSGWGVGKDQSKVFIGRSTTKNGISKAIFI